MCACAYDLKRAALRWEKVIIIIITVSVYEREYWWPSYKDRTAMTPKTVNPSWRRIPEGGTDQVPTFLVLLCHFCSADAVPFLRDRYFFYPYCRSLRDSRVTAAKSRFFRCRHLNRAQTIGYVRLATSTRRCRRSPRLCVLYERIERFSSTRVAKSVIVTIVSAAGHWHVIFRSVDFSANVPVHACRKRNSAFRAKARRGNSFCRPRFEGTGPIRFSERYKK